MAGKALLIPFFLSITFGDQDDSASSPMELSTVSSIVANLSGLMTGALYLFLRGRSASPVGSSKHETYDFDSKYFGKAAEKRISEHGAGQDYTVRISSPSIYSQADDGTHWLQLKSEEANVQGFMGSSKAEKGIPLATNQDDSHRGLFKSRHRGPYYGEALQVFYRALPGSRQ
ncbi:hypothetical protein ACO1O0_009105 [Amphichorda felina]